jgi:hypothetical protein
MTHEQLVERLEGERVRDPRHLEAERYAPEPPPVVRPWTPMTTQQAARNLSALRRALHEADRRTRK